MEFGRSALTGVVFVKEICRVNLQEDILVKHRQASSQHDRKSIETQSLWKDLLPNMSHRAQTSEARLNLVSLIVNGYDEAIEFFVSKLGFSLTEDSPSTSTATGASKRWVVVHPPGNSTASTGLLLAEADGEEQKAIVGKQWAGRVGMFMQVNDFEEQYRRMKEVGVEFLEEPRNEPYGQVVVFRDIYGNKWDLLGPLKQIEVAT